MQILKTTAIFNPDFDLWKKLKKKKNWWFLWSRLVLSSLQCRRSKSTLIKKNVFSERIITPHRPVGIVLLPFLVVLRASLNLSRRHKKCKILALVECTKACVQIHREIKAASAWETAIKRWGKCNKGRSKPGYRVLIVLQFKNCTTTFVVCPHISDDLPLYSVQSNSCWMKLTGVTGMSLTHLKGCREGLITTVDALSPYESVAVVPSRDNNYLQIITQHKLET